MSNFKNNSKNIIVDKFIIYLLLIVFLFFKSLKTLSQIFSYGFFKKETLTTKSNLGVDIKIKFK